MTVEAALTTATQSLAKFPSSRLDAEVLMAYVLRKDRTWLLAHPGERLPQREQQHFQDLVTRRLDGRPVAYLVGEKEFRGRTFMVDPSVLVPRPESELLVELALAHIVTGDSLVDVGTGSGCLGLSIAAERPDVDVHLVDISAVALSRAADNAAKLGVPHVRLHRADLWPEIGLDPSQTVVIANLPYVPDAEVETDQTLRHEPRGALAGGKDGLDVIRRFLQELSRRNFYPRTILLEHGADQAPALAKLVSGTAQVHCDLAGKPRVTELFPVHLKVSAE